MTIKLRKLNGEYARMTKSERLKYLGKELELYIDSKPKHRIFQLNKLKQFLKSITPKNYKIYLVGNALKFQYKYKVFKRPVYSTYEFMFYKRTTKEITDLKKVLGNLRN